MSPYFLPIVSDLGIQDCPCGVLLLGYGMRHGPRPTSVVTTRSAVGLLIRSKTSRTR
jgi:hypothetical protein